MVRDGEFNTADVKRVLRKHWWILPLCATSFATLSVLIAMQLPKQYTSQTLVLVARPAVPEEYVKPVVTEDLGQRLASMKEQILSRTRLELVINKFSLYAAERSKLHLEDLVDRLRTAIVITPLDAMPGTMGPNLPGFSVKVTFGNPQLAQQICTDITSMFMEQNARSLEQQASRTTSFIIQQLEEAKGKLDAQDAKLAQFKRQHIGLLPEEDQRNLSFLGSLNSELDATTQGLTRTQQDKSLNETLLTQQEASWKASQKGQNPETLEEQLRARQEQLTLLESRYTEEHPDVLKLRTEIAELKKKIEQMPTIDDSTAKSRKATEPPQLQQLRARIRQDELNYAELQKRQAKVQDQIRVVESHIEASPMVELQLKEMTRNYQSALDFYNELLKKRDNSEMASNLIHLQEGEQFRVLDSPSLPTSPSFPIMLNFAGGGFGGGMVLGLGILYLLMATDKTLRTEREVEMFLKLPVLASLPILEPLGGTVGSARYLKRSMAARH
jgi:polysaccharide chain length determinant protein (PEP-CTERM system associated)